MFYKHSRIKQYLKDGRAMRIETVVNAPRDLGCNARLPNLDELQAKARAANRRILETERGGQGTVLASPAFERVAHPTADAEGRRTPALRFGDPRVMALAGALCQTLLAATGFTNKNLRALIAGLLGNAYTPGQMTYDLRRLRLNGLIRRLPHTNRYTLTEDGIRIAWSPGNFVDISIMLLLVSNCQIGARNPLGLSCRADVVSGRDCNIARCSRTRRS